MEKKKTPKVVRVDWDLWKTYEVSPLREVGLVASSTTPASQKPQVVQVMDIINTGLRGVEIQAWIPGSGKEGSPLKEQELEMIRELAKTAGVKITVHGPSGGPSLPFSSDEAVETELLNSIRTAALVTFRKEDLENKEKIPELIKKSRDALVNVHMGTLGLPYGGLKAGLGRELEYQGIGKAYAIGSKRLVQIGDEIKQVYNLRSNFFPALNVLEAVDPELSRNFERKFLELRRKYELGEITEDEYIRRKKELEKEIDDIVKNAFKLIPSEEMNPQVLLSTTEYLKKRLRNVWGMIERDVREFYKLLKENKLSEAEKKIDYIINKITSEPTASMYSTDIASALRDYLRAIIGIKSRGQDVKEFVTSKMLEEGKSMDEITKVINNPDELIRKAKEYYEKEVEKTYSLMKDIGKRYGLPESFFKVDKDLMKRMGEKVIEEYGVVPLSQVVSIDEISIDRSAERVAKTLAKWFEKHGWIPRFVIENEPAPAAGADLNLLIETVKKARQKFREEILKRKDKIEKELGIKITEDLLKEMENRIGITIDTAHLWMWTAHGKTEKEVLEEFKKALDSGYVLHIHAVDTLPDLGHHHLFPGHGTLDWKKINELLKKKKEEGKIPEDLMLVLEPHDSIQFLVGVGGQNYGPYLAGAYTGYVTYGYGLFEPAYAYGFFPIEGYYLTEGTGYFFAFEEGKERGGGR